MTREEAKEILTHNWTRVDNPNYSESELDEAFFMAIEALSADATVAKIKIDDIDKAKTSSQLLDDLAVDMVKAMGKRIVEVVRCKDCIHWKADNEVFELGFCCVFPQKWVAETFYCADGERREPDKCE